MKAKFVVIKWVIFQASFFASIFLTNLTDASQELAKEQVAVIGNFSADLGGIDPLGATVGPDRIVFHHIWGGLVRYPTGDSNSLDFEPGLAERWDVSSDKLTWTFHLRKHVKWHWGYGEVTSEDVVYSLERVRDGKVSPYRPSYANFREIRALDRYTVQIVTAKPEPFLLTKVANYFGGFVVCKKALEEIGGKDTLMSIAKGRIVGTGPFRFADYKTKDNVTLVRNDEYWRGKLIIEKLILKFILDDGVREVALLKGEIAGAKGVDDGKWLKHIKGKGIVVEPMGSVDLKTIYFNLSHKPFDDKRVREAFAWTMGQDAIIQMQGEEISSYCTSPVPSGFPGHIDARWAKYNKRDIPKAKALLAEAGYPDGFKLKLWMSSGPWFLNKMIIYQNQLRDIGVELDMTLVDNTAYLSKISQGLNPLCIRGTRLPLATEWLRFFFHSDSIIGKSSAAANYMYYSNPDVDRLIEIAETTFDEKARNDALAKAQRIIVEDLPAIGSVETRTACVRNPWFDLGYAPKNNYLWNYEVDINTKILKH